MVNPEELRIGNYIRYEEEGFFLVRRIGRDDIEGVWISDGVTTTENDPPEAFEPIPLTPELLEKAGFVMDEEQGCYKHYSGNYANIDHDGSIAFFLYEVWGGYKTVNYLHQLQNLYYALMEKELPIEL